MLTPSISTVLNNIGESPFWLSEGRSAFRSFEHPILRQPFFKPSAITFAETLSHFPMVLSEKPHPESDGVHSSNRTRTRALCWRRQSSREASECESSARHRQQPKAERRPAQTTLRPAPCGSKFIIDSRNERRRKCA